jgi:hypothetical protein
MKLSTSIATLATAAVLSGGMAALASGGAVAHASGTTTETVSQVNTVLNSGSYREVRREVEYYSHSSTKGWVAEPAPKVTVTVSTHAYAKSGSAARPGAVSETVSQVNTMLSPLSYREVRVEHEYYSHSSTKGWVAEPAPRVTTTVSTHVYAK